MKSHIFLSCFLVPVALLATTVYASDGWNIQTVDNSGNTGYYSSLAYDSNGYPHIAYYNSSSRSLMYARWTGEGWQCETVRSPVGHYKQPIGQYCSIVMDDEDRPHIAYYTVDSSYYYGYGGGLSYTFRDHSGWHHTDRIAWLGFGVYTGLHTSIAVSRDPNLGTVVPHIIYYAQTGGDLRYAW